MTPRFFDGVQPWSYYKHRILSHYLEIWAKKLSSRHRRLAFVDTCAGTGRYDTGEPGSPLIAAELNDHTTLVAHGVTLAVIACEADPGNRAELERALRRWTTAVPPRAVVLAGQFQQDLPRIVDATREVPTLFFIDPFGMKDVSIDALRPILETNSDRKEILVRVPHRMLARWHGRLQERPKSERHARELAAFGRNLEACNVDPAFAAELASPDYPMEARQQALLDRYLDPIYDRFKWVQLVPIQATWTGAPRYFMLHATDSEHGCALLNDVASSVRDELYNDTERMKDARKGQGSLFETLATPRITPASEIDDIIRGVAGSKWIEVRAILSRALGPEFRKKDHEAAFKRLVASGQLRATLKAVPADYEIVRLV